MSEQFVSQIVMFAGGFAPRSWALCDGQLLAVSSNDALFSLVGTIYGGDGRTTFGLPDMRGRAAIHAGQGAGLSSYRLGQKSGAETNTMTTNNMASHGHTASATVAVTDTTGDLPSPTGNFLAPDQSNENSYNVAKGTDQFLNPGAVSITLANTGGQRSFNNMAPSLAVNYVIALYGVYPSRQ